MAGLVAASGLLSVASLLLVFGAELAAAGFDYKDSGLDWPGACATGNRQSPINIVTSRAKNCGVDVDLKFMYEQYTKLEVLNYIRLEVLPPPGSNSLFITSNATYKLINIHTHTFSEHSIDGFFGTLEVHFVHQYTGAVENGTKPPLAVVGVVLGLDPDDKPNAWVDQLLAFMPSSNNTAYEVTLPSPFRLASLFIPSSTSKLDYYTYPGSLTTPNCDERVTWYVLRQVQTMSVLQFEKVGNITEATTGERIDDRPPQPFNGRVLRFLRASAVKSKIDLNPVTIQP